MAICRKILSLEMDLSLLITLVTTVFSMLKISSGLKICPGASFSKILSPLVILSMEKTMVTKLIRELKSVSRLKILPETRPRSLLYGTCLDSRVFDFLISCQTWPYSLRSEGSLWIPRPTAQFYKGFYSQFLASICPRHPLPGIRSGFL